MLLFERISATGALEKKVFCSELQEFNCWPPVIICTTSSICTSMSCGKEILPGHLMIKNPTILHYECLDASKQSVRCILCEEEILRSHSSVPFRLCNAYGFKHYPTCKAPALNANEGVTSAESSQDVAISDSDMESSVSHNKRRRSS